MPIFELPRRETFSDDTSTGRLRVARGPRRAIIAAAVNGHDYDWWSRLRRRYFPGVEEVKSAEVINLVSTNPEARDELLRGLADARTAIVVIDFSEFTASLVRAVYEGAGLKLDADPLDILEQKRLRPDVAEAVIRYSQREGLEQSTVSRIEWLLHEALDAAPVLIDEQPFSLVDRDAFDKLDPNAKGVFLARFAVVFAEALDPKRQVRLIENALQDSRFFDRGNFAYERLEEALTADRTFDQGDSRAIRLVTEAHEQMVATLDQAMHKQLVRRAGAIKEEDSLNAIGIRVADVAAGLAAAEYEAASGEVREKAARLHTTFDRVLLNDTWL